MKCRLDDSPVTIVKNWVTEDFRKKSRAAKYDLDREVLETTKGIRFVVAYKLDR